MRARFGANLWWLRTQRRFSQEHLADRAEIHRTQISMLENGERSPLLPTLLTLAGGLDVPLGTLLEGISFSPAGDRPGRFVVEPIDLPILKKRVT
jgi:transcriptional regulator with XRE-family HTH domain